jgi:hypothetical protein
MINTQLRRSVPNLVNTYRKLVVKVWSKGSFKQLDELRRVCVTQDTTVCCFPMVVCNHGTQDRHGEVS